MIERRPHEDMARTGEVGQVGQLHTCKKAYENRNLTKLANFLNGLVGLEDSTPPYVCFANSMELHRCVSAEIVANRSFPKRCHEPGGIRTPARLGIVFHTSLPIVFRNDDYVSEELENFRRVFRASSTC